MNSKKSIIMIIALAVLGTALFFSLNTIHPAISFLIGVVATVFIQSVSTSTQSSSNSEKASTQTLYVGNLPYKANESNVRQVFSEHGEVFAVRLMKDKRTGKRRGFGFVVVAESDADEVIAALNEKDYMQRTLKVRVANDPKHPEGGMSELD
ncbi:MULTISPECIES: RNA recognition motif domain-containing protein [Vibrio]|uniref:RNA-binding protein n=1 Tax=Vibrio casei TaxID=673372 RepID=A0A368LKU8_9VIBR|nr:MULTISPECIES: RNA-binding protein [Vibrio]RCS72133.1 RNA-binding protein [Vibrio casei]SJN21279.1 RNA-binding protein [Vibrio casei]HBV76563.1 RNA-binding protein [Vibrio sp.]